ncbi:hypothetical protein [Candidatus Contubernalis alkaliaceticus]|uniref:hypothetical protein n=1 Tax=Candidatus Contubernalis alkaliaceticus TaxID=338645 RepID=UPI001F4C09BF|nr:hypothetical protein [Candidatus Contubernalis alkalaceticus]UNC93097.1 hypothetical protein HUE98_13950 [Candidatus Contubernalis alkalaceticus]
MRSLGKIIYLLTLLLLVINFLFITVAFAEVNNSQEIIQYDFEKIAEHEIIKARENGENIYQYYVPDFDNIPEKDRRTIANKFNELYFAEQEIVNMINMTPVADDELSKDEIPAMEGLLSYYHIPRGTDRNLGMSFGTSNGNSGGWGFQRSSTWNAHTNLHSLRTNNTVRFTAGSWSWGVLERRIWITGSGSQWAGIHFGPIDYWQELAVNALGDTAAVKIRVELWDVTSSPVTLLASSNVLNVSKNSGWPQQYSGSPSRSLYYELQAGRAYAIRLVQEGSAGCVGSEYWNGQKSLGWTTKMANLWINWYNW